MIKRFILNYLNKRDYDIVKLPGFGKKYPNLIKGGREYYCETPIGKYYLPINPNLDPVTNMMYRGQFFESENIKIAKKYIKKGSTVLDIGANFGQFSIEFSKAVGSDGLVYSFEAQDSILYFLKKNISINNCNNVIIKEGAVYNISGKVLIFPEPEMSGHTYSSNAINPKLFLGRKVETITIDSLAIETPISFMKVDIQGSDLFAMQGAKQTILRHKMPIFFEFEEQFQNQFETNFQDYVDFVSEINYKFIHVIDSINFLIVPK